MSRARVNVIMYSLYHHVHKLGLEVHKGLEAAGVQSKMYQGNVYNATHHRLDTNLNFINVVPETLSPEILKLVKAPPRPDLPIATLEQLTEADGVLFGFPTRYGGMPAQMRAFVDGTGGLWAKGALHGKFAGTFFSTGSQHGGKSWNNRMLVVILIDYFRSGNYSINFASCLCSSRHGLCTYWFQKFCKL